MVDALADVLDALARAIDDELPGVDTLGRVTLHPHQREAVRRVRAAIAEFGGALLADDPGLGKTFTALAVAREYASCLVAAPASLREMWHEASARSGVAVRFVSLEAMSRGQLPAGAALLIVDEAHHATNERANRHAPLASLAAGAHVLLLTATPVRNRRSDLDALLGFFLGSRSRALDEAALARCIIRRTVSSSQHIPEVQSRAIARPRGGAAIAELLTALPPPVPLTDGVPAAALVGTMLARCWASSLAAFDRALARRVQRGLAIRDLIDAGRHPTHAELRAWIVGDDATQLALPLGIGNALPDSAALRRSVDAHVAAIVVLRNAVRPRLKRDASWRAAQLRAIAAAHVGSPVIAFTTFEATATAFFQQLRDTVGVVLLTSRRARTVGGTVPRSLVIGMLGPDAELHRTTNTRFPLRIIISTDVLSEGVNLQGAAAVVHLDYPWTPAAVAQRTGRVARIGSRNRSVTEYRFTPPAAAERLLRIPVYHRRKAESAREALEPSSVFEALRSECRSWLHAAPWAGCGAAAAARASVDGFIARLESPTRAWLVGARASARISYRVTDDPRVVLTLVRSVSRAEARAPHKHEVARVSFAVNRWLDRRQAAVAADTATAASPSLRQALARLDGLVRACSPSRLPTVAARVGRLRALISAATGAALELHLRAMLGRPADDSGWLAEFETRMRRVSTHSASLDRPEIVALLLLRAQAATGRHAAPGNTTTTLMEGPVPPPSHRPHKQLSLLGWADHIGLSSTD